MFTAISIAMAVPVAAQDYTIVSLSHTSNGIHEIDPATGKILQDIGSPTSGSASPMRGRSLQTAKSSMRQSVQEQVVALDGDTFKPIEIIESEYFSGPARRAASYRWAAGDDAGRPARAGIEQRRI